MKLTSEDVSRYVGGQVEIHDGKKGTLHLGEVETISIEEDVLKVTFTWMEECISLPTGWTEIDPWPFEARLKEFKVAPLSGDRVVLTSAQRGQLIVLNLFDKKKQEREWATGL